MKPKLNIAVTALNAIDSPGPGIAVIRGLMEAKSFDAKIIGFSYDALEPGIYMHDHVAKSYQIPYPSSGAEPLMERIKFIHSIEKIDIIIPNFDAELYSFMKLESKLKAMGISMLLPTLAQFEERHKVNLNAFGEKHNIHVPKSKIIHTTDYIAKLKDDFSYPVLVKGKYYDATIVYNDEQVKSAFNKISAKWGLPIIIQEFIHGSEFNVTGLGDGEGNTIAVVPMRKQYITDKGKAWGGVTIANKKILDIADNFIRSTKWKGPFEFDLMKNSENEFYLLEINPRMPAWIYLAVGAGQNIPEAVVNLALGNKVLPFENYAVGKMFVRYAYDMIVDIAEFQQMSTNGEL